MTPAIRRVVGRCLEKRPDDRFHSAHDLGLALELLSTANTNTSAPGAPAGIMGLVSLHATLDGRTQAYTWHRALSNWYVADGLV